MDISGPGSPPPPSSPSSPGETPRKGKKSRKKKKGQSVSTVQRPATLPHQKGATALPDTELPTIVVTVTGGRTPSRKARVNRLSAALKAAEVATDAELREEYDRVMTQQIETYRKHGESAETLFARTMIFARTGRVAMAGRVARQLLEKAEPGSLMEARGYFYCGLSMLADQKQVTDENSEYFKKAYELGLPEAGLYYIQAMLGLYDGASLLKWCDTTSLLKAGLQLKEMYTQRRTSVVEGAAKYPGLPEYSPEKLLCLTQVYAEEDFVNCFPDDPVTCFAYALCRFMLHEPDEEEKASKLMHESFDFLSKSNISVANCHSLYYTLVMARFGQRPDFIRQLKAINNPTAHFGLGYILSRKEPVNLREAQKHFRQALEIPQSYGQLIEVYLKQGDFDKALDCCYEGLEKLQSYDAGEVSFFGHQKGKQAQILVETKGDDELASAINKSECQAIQRLQIALEIKAELIAEVIHDEQSKQSSPGKGLQPLSESPQEDSGKAVDKQVCETDEPGVKSKVAEAAPDIDETGDDPRFPWQSSYRQKRYRSDEAIRKKIRQANRLMMAEGKIETIQELYAQVQPQHASVLWFEKLQSECWFLLHKVGGTISGLSKKTLTDTQKTDCLKQAEEKARAGMKEYFLLAARHGLPEIGSIDPCEEVSPQEVLACAQCLETLDPAYKRQFGGLYSTLGHLQTAMRDCSDQKKTREELIRKKNKSYHLANIIRGRIPATLSAQ